jgi:hypothetical protein
MLKTGEPKKNDAQVGLDIRRSTDILLCEREAGKKRGLRY